MDKSKPEKMHFLDLQKLKKTFHQNLMKNVVAFL